MVGEERLRSFIGEDDKVLSISPAFIEGKLYDGAIPIVVEIGELTKNKMPNITFGAFVVVESSNPMFFSILDSYEGCSMTRIGKNATNDLYHRKEVEVFVISAKTIQDLSDINYEVVNKDKAWVYFGNPNGVATTRAVRDNNRLFYWDTFLDLF